MKVSVVGEKKVLRIEDEGNTLELVNRCQIIEEKDMKLVEDFFRSWKIIRGIPIIPRASSVLPFDKQKPIVFRAEERIRRIRDAYDGKEILVKDMASLNNCTIWTCHLDAAEMVGRGSLLPLSKLGKSKRWRVISKEPPLVLSSEEIAKHRAEKKSESAVSR